MQIGIEAAAGLDYAHRRGLVHRDIKPANLLFDADGRLRIADFGLARALAEAPWTEPDGAILGTARYSAPEQVEGWVLDGKADVYALALVLYEGVTGEAPFIGDTTVATLMARVGSLLPEHEALGPLNDVLVWAAAPEPVRALRRRPAGAALRGPGRHPARARAAAHRRRRPSTRPDDLDRVIGATGPRPGVRPPDARTSPSWAPPALIGQPRDRAPKQRRTLHRRRRPARRSAPDPAAAGPGSAAIVRGRGGPAGRGRGLLSPSRPSCFTPSHPVPLLVGKTLAQADQAVQAGHFHVRTTGHASSITVGRRPDPEPAARPRSGGKPVTLKQGSTIDVVVSAGPPPVAIPDLTSFTSCTDAVQALRPQPPGRGVPGVRRPVQLDRGRRGRPRHRRPPAPPPTARR